MKLEIPTIRTARLTLAPMARTHLDAYIDSYGDPEVIRHIGEPLDRSATWGLMSRLAGHWVLGALGESTVQLGDTDKTLAGGFVPNSVRCAGATRPASLGSAHGHH